MSFHLTGRYIETKARGRASSDEEAPGTGSKDGNCMVDGKEREVPIQQVRVGDIMLVRPGEKSHRRRCGGRESAVDESMALENPCL